MSVRFGILLCVMALFAQATTHAGGVGKPTDQMPVKTTKDSTIIGQVKWEITETSTGQLLAQGARVVKMSDVNVIAGRGGDYLEQRLPLSERFYLKLNSGRSEKPFSGFGIAAGKDDQLTFSWEWFNVKKPGYARKLQETGELEFHSMQIGDQYEITRLRFLTDVSLRVMDYENAGAAGIKNPEWRVKILKGSEITWPTIAGGKVRSAADAAAWHKANPPPPGFWSSVLRVAAEETTATE